MAAPALPRLGGLRGLSEPHHRAAERALGLSIGALFATGRVADLLLAVLAAEAAWFAWRHRTGRPVPAGAIAFLLAGAALALALRLALTGAWWGWIALCLAASGAAHALDLARRWPRG